MNIRPATPDDAPALAKVHIDSWRSAYRGLVPDSHLAKLDYGRRAERFRESLSTHSEETYLVEDNGEVLGFLTLVGIVAWDRTPDPNELNRRASFLEQDIRSLDTGQKCLFVARKSGRIVGFAAVYSTKARPDQC